MEKNTHLQLEQDDKKYIWHPFTQMLDYEKEKPLIIEKGKGSYLWVTMEQLPSSPLSRT